MSSLNRIEDIILSVKFHVFTHQKEVSRKFSNIIFKTLINIFLKSEFLINFFLSLLLPNYAILELDIFIEIQVRVNKLFTWKLNIAQFLDSLSILGEISN